MIVDGLLLGAAFTVVAVGSLWLDARIWIEDYPAEIRQAAGPVGEAPLALRLTTAALLFGIMLGGMVSSNWMVGRQHRWKTGFRSVFVHTLVLFWVVNLVDVVIVDWLIFVTIQPEFVVLEGTDGLAAYDDYWFHLEASVASWQPWIGSLIIAGVMGAALPRLWRRRGESADAPVPSARVDRQGVRLTYRVLVDDNAHYMDESERYELGEFETLEAAVAACQKLVDEFLTTSYRPGMTPAELLAQYKHFGEDPFVVADGGTDPFSAHSYAAARVREICGDA